MRGTDGASGSLFRYFDLEDRIPARHPPRKIHQVVNEALSGLDGHPELRAALDMIHRHSPGSTRQLTLGADKGFDGLCCTNGVIPAA